MIWQKKRETKGTLKLVHDASMRHEQFSVHMSNSKHLIIMAPKAKKGNKDFNDILKFKYLFANFWAFSSCSRYEFCYPGFLLMCFLIVWYESIHDSRFKNWSNDSRYDLRFDNYACQLIERFASFAVQFSFGPIVRAQ